MNLDKRRRQERCSSTKNAFYSVFFQYEHQQPWFIRMFLHIASNIWYEGKVPLLIALQLNCAISRLLLNTKAWQGHLVTQTRGTHSVNGDTKRSKKTTEFWLFSNLILAQRFPKTNNRACVLVVLCKVQSLAFLIFIFILSAESWMRRCKVSTHKVREMVTIQRKFNA